jgi:competence protein ComEC
MTRFFMHQMFLFVRGALPRSAVLAALLVASACSGGGSSGPAVQPPVITVTGVADGAVVEEPVTIFVTIDGGTFRATLNDEPFFSGGTVADPGTYLLRVEATNAGGTSIREVGFEIRFSGESLLIVRMLDLGENGAGGGGDALLVTDSSAAGMRHALIDAGPAGADAADPGFVQRRLAQLGVDTLQVLVLTHAHSDHYGGMLPVINGITVEEFVYNGQTRSLSSYEAVVSAANSRAGVVTVPAGTESRSLGLVGDPSTLAIIPGLADNLGVDTNDGSDLNDGSVGTSVIKGDFRMFVTGDGEVDANLRWRTDFASLTGDLTVLKVGHHGANDAVFDGGFANSGTAWLDHAGADVHLVSSNGTSHPRIAALNALLGRPGATYCTSVHGEIELRATAAGQWTVSVERNAGEDCVPGDDATS